MNAEPLLTAASLAFLWVWLCWLHPMQEVDLLRQRLFGLRDRLFDLPRTGVIRFDDDAYRVLSGTINGNIRFAHRVSFTLVISRWITLQIRPSARVFGEAYRRQWSEARSRCSPKAQRELDAIRGEMHRLIFLCMVRTSLLLPLGLAVLSAFFIGRVLFGYCVRAIFRPFSGSWSALTERLTFKVDSVAYCEAASIDRHIPMPALPLAA